MGMQMEERQGPCALARLQETSHEVSFWVPDAQVVSVGAGPGE